MKRAGKTLAVAIVSASTVYIISERLNQKCVQLQERIGVFEERLGVVWSTVDKMDRALRASTQLPHGPTPV